VKFGHVVGLLGVIVLLSFLWRPSVPEPVERTLNLDGYEFHVTSNARPSGYEGMVFPSLVEGGESDPPKSFVRSRLCDAQPGALAQLKARLLLTPGSASRYGWLVTDCLADDALCRRAAELVRLDGGLSASEFTFFAQALHRCDRATFVSLRDDSRLSDELWAQAFAEQGDAGVWEPRLDALLREALDGGDSPAFIALAASRVPAGPPAFIELASQLARRDEHAAWALRRSRIPELQAAACEHADCDGGSDEARFEQADDAGERVEWLAQCALQNAELGDACLSRLSGVDWAVARSVARMTGDANESVWAPILREFETRAAWDAFVKSLAPDGGTLPVGVVPDGRFTATQWFDASRWQSNADVTAKWARLAPELHGLFAGDFPNRAGVVSAWVGGERLDGFLRETDRGADGRGVISFLNVIAAERGLTSRFFVIVRGMPMVVFASPDLIETLEARHLLRRADLTRP
jgi:hypothetical protein